MGGGLCVEPFHNFSNGCGVGNGARAARRFAYIPQVHDASPRVTTQALMNDVPLLMNRNIMGGWKYVE